MIEKWDVLDKSQILTIANKCKELAKCRDINNKFRACLLHIRTYSFSLEDFHQLFKIISETTVDEK